MTSKSQMYVLPVVSVMVSIDRWFVSCRPVPDAPLTRLPSFVLPPSPKTPQFIINSANRSYQHQYANIYFLRLRLLRDFVEENARKRWKNVDGAYLERFGLASTKLPHTGNPIYVPRVLDIVKGKLCYMIGTVYLDMPLKPNVLEDIARDVRLPRTSHG